jgi:sterol desaturase/sphingolipid hydroxylase (fatty acid hydroxylase superfamily)
MTINADAPRPAPWMIMWLTWPLLFIVGTGGAYLAIAAGFTYWLFNGIFVGFCIAIFLTHEFKFQVRRTWMMTKRSFTRDLKYFAMSIVMLGAINTGLGYISIKAGAGNTGPITDWPLYLAVPAALVCFEFPQYWLHRWSHELGGPIGKFLWRAHAAHHLPDKVYLFMHAASHPINVFLVRAVIMVPVLFLLGATAETVLLFNIINGYQGLVSHFNVDLRVGWFNFIFAGTELHRYHHSAEAVESKNYGTGLSIFDILFGTFHYRPGSVPDRIGVEQPAEYPESNEFWQVMALPFRRDSIAGS